jgi:hypothetical protein
LGPELFGHGKTKDYPLWFWVGRQFLAGGDIYGGHFRFLYPPFAAMLMAPLSLLGRAPMYAALVALNIAAWWAALKLSASLAGADRPSPWWLVIAPSALLFPSLFDTFDLGQTNLALLAMMLAGLWLLRAKREGAAGVLFATAAAIKAFPIAILPYLLWRRRWRAAGAMAAFMAVFLLLAPAPVRGFSRNLADLRTWTQGLVFNAGQGGLGQRHQQNLGWKNQSLIAVSTRLLRHVNAEKQGAPEIYVNFLDLSFEAANAVILAVAAVIGAGFLALMPSRGRTTSASDAAEWAVLIALITVASPLTRQYYFVWLLFPVTLLIRRAASAPIRSARRVIGTALICAFALMALSLPWPGAHLFQAAGNNLAATAILIGALIWLMRREAAPRKESAPYAGAPSPAT